MIFKEITFEFINSNKNLVYSYIFIASLVEIIKVVVLSFYYSKVIKHIDKFYDNIKNIIYIWVLLCLLYVIKNNQEAKIYSEMIFYVRNTLYKKYLNYNYYNFNDVNTSYDVINIFEASQTIRDIFYFICQNIIPTLLLGCTINIYFIVKHRNVGIINMVSNIINYLILKFYSNDIISVATERQNKTNKIITKLQETFGNMIDIFLNEKIENTLQKNLLLEQNLASITRDEFTKISTFINILKVSNYFFSIISIYYLYKNVDTEEFINCILIFSFYVGVLQDLSENIPKFIKLITSLNHLETLLAPKLQDISIVDNCNNKPIINGTITFNNINFGYNTKSYDILCNLNNKLSDNDTIVNVLKNFNLNIIQGERVAIIAPSGSGKTTIMKLLLKFYKPQEGMIMLDNININDINTKHIRKQINYINQKTVLFNDTIINNMKYGNNMTDKEIIDLMTRYDLLSLFNNDTNELNKMVEINGTNISMGIQKIIFLIRGILKSDCSIYIFDEPLTSLDTNTRKKVMNIISNIVGNKTTIIITHDMEINSIVDRVIELKPIS